MGREVEIKFRLKSVRQLERELRAAGFHQVTRSAREVNTLYDLPGEVLRNRRELLRLRHYGLVWKLTHKSRGKKGLHSSRVELETSVGDGKTMDAIFRGLGYSPSFKYEKFRAEWADGRGHVVIDQTPIGDFAEIEGAPRWIDATAKKLGVTESEYITKNYATLFLDWKADTKSDAVEMTFKAVGRRSRFSVNNK